MPNNQLQNYRRRYNPIPYNTMYRAAKFAAERLKKNYRIGNTVPRTFGKMYPPVPKNSTNTANGVGSTPSTTISSYAGGNDYTRNKTVKRSKRPKTNKGKIALNHLLIRNLMDQHVYRFQGITNYDTNLGHFVIRNARNTTSGVVDSPIHVYTLSSFNNEGFANVGYALGWDSVANTANLRQTPLAGQSQLGTSTSSWVNEDNNLNTPFPASKNAMHDWTSIKFNFYGARKRTTYFEVMIIQMLDEFADPVIANTANIAFKELVQYWERPLIYSNLQTDVQGNAHKKYRVLMRKRYYVSASQTTDVDTTVGKVKEANIFIRHDRLRHYDWQHSTDLATNVLPHGDADGVQYIRDGDVHNDAGPGKRIYMVVRAFSPERALYTDASPSISAERDPSYDIVIRNKFSMTRGITSN